MRLRHERSAHRLAAMALLVLVLAPACDGGLQIVATRGTRCDPRTCAFPSVCTGADRDRCARPAGWYGVGGSDFGPTRTRVTWDSASGAGVTAEGTSCYGPALATGRDGQPILTYGCEPSSSWASVSEIYIRRWDGSRWAEVGAGSMREGGVSNTPVTISSWPSIALLQDGSPMLAWHDYYREVYVRRLQGDTWVEVGEGSATGCGISCSAGWISGPQLALDAAGAPTVAWADKTSGNYEIYIRRLRGGAWEEIGQGSASGGGISSSPASSGGARLALDAAGDPVVLWGDSYAGADVLYLKRWRDGQWREVTAGSASGAGIVPVAGYLYGWSMVLDPAGEPLVAFAVGPQDQGEILVMRWDGAVWLEVGQGSLEPGGVSRSPGHSKAPAVQLDAAGSPVVAWLEYAGSVGILGAGTLSVYVRRLQGLQWVEVGAGSASGSGINGAEGWIDSFSLALDAAGDPCVAWADTTPGNKEIFLLRYTQDRWQPLGRGTGTGGGLSASPGSSVQPALAFDAAGLPAVAWVEVVSGQAQIYAVRWSEGSWEEAGVGAASGGGISDGVGSNLGPRLAAAPGGELTLAWSHSQDYRSNVYVKQLRDGRWQELGAGSASGGGVSDSATSAGGPLLAFDGAGRPVLAWSERGSETQLSHALVKVFDAAGWVELGAGAGSGTGVSGDIEGLSLEAMLGGAEGPLYLAWSESLESYKRGCQLRRFDGEGWAEVALDGPAADLAAGRNAFNVRLAQAPGGALLLAWWGGQGARVQRLQAERWEDVGAASSEGEGWLGEVGNGFALAVGDSGRPLIAWSGHSGDGGAAQIYAIGYDGGAWDEVAPGSASGGGVSNSVAASNEPSLAVHGDTACIAWSEAGRGATEIVLRCARVP